MDLLVDKPLRRGASVISPEGDKSWVAFKYERIVDLYYSCGRGHELKTCPHRGSNSNMSKDGNLPYDDWLRAGMKRRGDGLQSNETGQAKGHKHGRNGTPDGMFLKLGNPSGLPRMATTSKEATPDFGDVSGQTNAKLGRAELIVLEAQIVLEVQSEGGELMQCNVLSIEGKGAGAINMVPPLTPAHSYGKIRHVHEMIDGTSKGGGDKNACDLDNVGNHATPNTTQPTWTRLSRIQCSEAIEKQSEQRQKWAKNREFYASNVTPDPVSLRNEKRTKLGYHTYQRWRLWCSPVDYNNCYKLELSRAWEPTSNGHTHQHGEK